MEFVARAINAYHTFKDRVKPFLPSACQEGEGPEGPPGTREFPNAYYGAGRMEMTQFNSYPNQTADGQGYAEYGTVEYQTEGADDGGGGADAHGLTGEKIDEWQAGWNVTNAIQGMFIVSLPYAVLHGGYWGVFALVFVAYICCHTGKILVACLYEPNERGEMVRVRDSYVAIAQVCLGEKYGGKMVNIAQNIELLMTCILYVVLCGDLLIGSFPDGVIDQRSWMMICAMLLLPCAFLKNLKAVSALSFWCTIAHVIINVVIFGYCFLCIGDWQWSKVTFHLDWSTFPITLGIVVFSYTSQIFLPSLEGSMKDPSKFHCMLDYSHIAAAVFKGLFAYVGFLTFGEETQEVITNNLPTHGFKAFINLVLVAKALLSYPLPYYASACLIETTFFRGKPSEYRPDGEGPQPFPSCWTRDGDYRVWAVSLRVCLILFTLVMAVSIPHFALLMGLIGSFTGTMLSFVWPCYFHMKLKWDVMTTEQRVWECSIIFIGVTCGIIGIYTSFSALVEAYHLPLPYVPGKHPVHG